MTEDEAKTKWCPTASVPGITGGKNRDAYGYPEPKAHCVGSVCMAWRWEPIRGFSDEEMAPFEGFCGLTGRP
jgi:hypothetical protein